ncbi:hypothetical protein CSKR_110757 [Clonorchis sinensis]|uniref:Uncharacterized protein n=1 Tax=Clonorchis sinensis TaxID=79923 RepID=A0A419Q210_CLOSI|nr:hypothetical protein CSKR_110757 [Clonorchis sinensis]
MGKRDHGGLAYNNRPRQKAPTTPKRLVTSFASPCHSKFRPPLDFGHSKLGRRNIFHPGRRIRWFQPRLKDVPDLPFGGEKCSKVLPDGYPNRREYGYTTDFVQEPIYMGDSPSLKSIPSDLPSPPSRFHNPVNIVKINVMTDVKSR